MDNLNDVIDNICEKIGVTAEYIVPEYARMMIARGITRLILFTIIVVAIILFNKWLSGHEDDDIVGGCRVISGGISAIIFVFASITFNANRSGIYSTIFPSVIVFCLAAPIA